MSRLSSLEWEIAIITAIILVVPAGMVFAEGVFSADEESESYFSPEKVEDFRSPQGAFVKGDGVPTQRTSYIEYRYINTTGANMFVTDSGLYTKNQTGQDFHEFLAQTDPDDSGSFDEFVGLSVQLNYSIEEAINDDMKQVRVTAEFPRNSTIRFQTVAVDSAGDQRYVLNDVDQNVTADMSTYNLDVDYSKLLDADSTLGEDSYMHILFESGTTDADEIQPGDSLKFNIDLMSGYIASPLITTNFFAGLMGGISLLAGVFTSPWIDFKDVYGPLLGAIK